MKDLHKQMEETFDRFFFSGSGPTTTSTSTSSARGFYDLPPRPTAHLYIEMRPEEWTGEPQVYSLSQEHFPGSRVLFGPELERLPQATRDAITDLCPDVLRRDTAPDERARLMATYWPDPPMKLPTRFYKSNHGGTP